MNILLRLNPNHVPTDFISHYKMNINTTKTLSILESTIDESVVLLDVIGISEADKNHIDDMLISLKSRMKYEWNYSDQDVANWLLSQKSLTEKSDPDSPLRQYYFDQIDLSVRLNDPILSQSLSNSNRSKETERIISYTDIGKICWLVQESKLIRREDLTQENFCKQVCSELKMPYSDNVRQSFRKYDTGNHTLTKKIISNLQKKVFPQLLESHRNSLESYLITKSFR